VEILKAALLLRISASRLEDELRLSCAITGELVGAYQV